MAKRFTDTDKWNRPWFRKLPRAYKLLWSFMTDTCDIAGIWYIDFELASFLIGEELVEADALRLFEKQIKVLPCGSRWLLEGFIAFQYGKLVPNNNMHRAVIHRIDSLSNPAPSQGLFSPSAGAKDKDKDKDTTLLAAVDSDPFDAWFWPDYPRKEAKKDARKAWDKLRPDAATQAKIRAALAAKKGTDQWLKQDGQFVPLPATFIRGARWEDELSVMRAGPTAPKASTSPGSFVPPERLQGESADDYDFRVADAKYKADMAFIAEQERSQKASRTAA